MNGFDNLQAIRVGTGSALGKLCQESSISKQCEYPVKFTGVRWLLALAIGTGSCISPNILHAIQTTGGEYFDLGGPTEHSHHDIAIASTKDQVNALKVRLGLSVSDVATVLHVQRPTVYQWLAGAEPRRANLQRLHRLYVIANEWSELNNKSLGGYLRAPILNDKSLLDLLCQDDIDQLQVSFVLKTINEKLVSDHQTKSRRSIAARLVQKGYEQPSKTDQLANIRGVGSLVSSHED